MSRAYAAIAGAYVGRTVELAPHLESWARGDRYAVVLRVTGRGFTVRTTRGRKTLRNITDSMIHRYLDD